MSKSLKKNFGFNLIHTITSVLFPLITFPYAARIIQPDGIGLVNFYSSIINYIVLLTSIGIPLYATREIARVRDNERMREKTALEILLLNCILTIFGYVLVFVLCAVVSKIQIDIPLFLICSLSILFTTIGCEWFYNGVEDFKYIAIRGVIVKVLSVFMLFIFVKTKDDLLLYGVYSVIGVVGGNIFNFIRLHKYIEPSRIRFSELNIFRHLKPSLHVFALNVVISLYTSLSTVILGFLKDAEYVGYFATAMKVASIAQSCFIALQGVMMPHMSNLLYLDQQEKFKELSQKVLNFAFFIGMPTTIGMLCTARYVILLFAGQSYTPTISALMILSPIIIIIAISGVLGIQILYPQGKENIVIKCTAIGAVVGLVLNFCLIPFLNHNGAALASLFAEVAVTGSMIYLGRDYWSLQFKNRSICTYVIASLVMGCCVHVITLLPIPVISGLLLSMSCSALVYAVLLYMVHDDMFIHLTEQILQSIKRKNGK